MTENTIAPVPAPLIAEGGVATWQDYMAFNKSAVLAALAAGGIARVQVSFDGQGDGGQIEEIEVIGPGEAELALPDTQIIIYTIPYDLTTTAIADACSLRDALEQVTYDALEHYEGGWENNDGAYGELQFDVEAGEARLQFNARYTSSDYSEHQL
ncbi:DUF6878 family protein [Asticcacaulis sp. W401b]|uniref:DUF6878 family protein n=1 Tax=Asticcacaulis sp. W401b TaxID=3388666 RepID=UPI003970806E